MCSATMRATLSVGLPAENGTIMVTGRSGYFWALAFCAANASIAATAARSLSCFLPMLRHMRFEVKGQI